MHSRLTPGERYDQWRRIRAGELRLVVGSRSAVFAPVRDLGVVILDEEHEVVLQTGQDTALPRARRGRVAWRAWPVPLASWAAPHLDLESVYRAERGEYVRLICRRGSWATGGS